MSSDSKLYFFDTSVIIIDLNYANLIILVIFFLNCQISLNINYFFINSEYLMIYLL